MLFRSGGCGIEILLPVVIFLAGMPCASTTPVLAEAAGLHEESRLCSLGVLVSTVLSVVTIPLLYALTEWLSACPLPLFQQNPAQGLLRGIFCIFARRIFSRMRRILSAE